jgi:tetratricopeptide (TPR) repeat protein
MRDADAEAQLGHFDEAHARSRQAVSLAPRDTVLAELDERYRTAGAYFPDISGDLREAFGAAAEDGVMKFIAGKDKEALASLANARELKSTAGIEGMIRVLEAKLGAPAPAVSTAAVVAAPVVAPPVVPEPAVSTAAVAAQPTGAEALKRILESTQALMEVSFFQQEWDKVVKLSEQVIALDPSNVNAYKRLAGAEHALKKHAEALKALKAAYALEPDEGERGKLKAYIAAMKAVVDKENRPAAAVKPARAKGSPEDVERLYESGVELYAQGRLIEAREAFRRCLEVDDSYIPAQRAFQRVQSEMMTTGKGQ